MRHNGTGAVDTEDLDTTPLELPASARIPMSLEEMIAKFIHAHVSEAKDQDQPEDYDEADDFEDEDPDLLDFSKYEFAEIQDDYDPTYNPDTRFAKPAALEPEKAPEAISSPQEGTDTPSPKGDSGERLDETG